MAVHRSISHSRSPSFQPGFIAFSVRARLTGRRADRFVSQFAELTWASARRPTNLKALRNGATSPSMIAIELDVRCFDESFLQVLTVRTGSQLQSGDRFVHRVRGCDFALQSARSVEVALRIDRMRRVRVTTWYSLHPRMLRDGSQNSRVHELSALGTLSTLGPTHLTRLTLVTLLTVSFTSPTHGRGCDVERFRCGAVTLASQSRSPAHVHARRADVRSRRLCPCPRFGRRAFLAMRGVRTFRVRVDQLSCVAQTPFMFV